MVATLTPTASPDNAPDRWGSGEWQPIRDAVYRTLVDMMVFPALSQDAVPLPNALRADAIQHGLIDGVAGRPSERLLELNPGLRVPDAP